MYITMYPVKNAKIFHCWNTRRNLRIRPCGI